MLNELCVYFVQEIIKPSKYFVTRWQSDQFASMSYSYVPVGCTADAYEHMSEPVNNKIFFAGEVYYLHSVLMCNAVINHWSPSKNLLYSKLGLA